MAGRLFCFFNEVEKDTMKQMSAVRPRGRHFEKPILVGCDFELPDLTPKADFGISWISFAVEPLQSELTTMTGGQLTLFRAVSRRAATEQHLFNFGEIQPWL